MNRRATAFLVTALAVTAVAGLARATDVDGPGDCGRAIRDFGDAPEGFVAYPGPGIVIGHFPTCLTVTAPGTQSATCIPISTAPGGTGFVRHEQAPGGYWLGCGASPTLLDDGVDSESDGKTSPGAPGSACSGIAVDCFEPAFGGTGFGQDECYGDSDAGLPGPALVFTTCTPTSISFRTFNCTTTAPRTVFLNILVDWNHDGDWNDNGPCPGSAACVYEWSVKNATITLSSGCATITSPTILPGPVRGPAWMRISISDDPAPDDYPWNGTAGISPTPLFRGGETEDYPVTIETAPVDPCDEAFEDFGDAPEHEVAYSSGVSGNFPTCRFVSGPSSQELDCPAISLAPGPTGHVQHVLTPGISPYFWLGCGAASLPHPGIDAEADGKINAIGGGSPSTCDPSVLADCTGPAFTGPIPFGQDECYGDADAGIAAPMTFVACSTGVVKFTTRSCAAVDRDVYLNILVDWNEDGDWNDNLRCSPTVCAYEWAVKNVVVTLPPGCGVHTSPTFLVGPRPGEGWLRITLTAAPVPDDFPWNGSAGLPGTVFRNGETEDYPVGIRKPVDRCAIRYRDFGDAPEGITAYASGVVGRFPTCLFATKAGSQSIDCGLPLSTLPGATGFVMHTAFETDPVHVWLGCGAPPTSDGIDGETNGKVNLSGAAGDPSRCDTLVATDCVEPAPGGMTFGQDECYGDGVDAGVAGPVPFAACSTGVVTFRATNCSPAAADVFLNVLVDWSADGDWNDVAPCANTGSCVPEWAVKNAPFILPPGCSATTSPAFGVGQRMGVSWMRVTLTRDPVPDDYPWNGSAGTPTGFFAGGETEDYPVEIVPSSLVDVGDRLVPSGLRLAIQPNPSWDGTNLHFAVPRQAPVRLAVYDVAGRKLVDLANRSFEPGEHTVRWNFRLSNGEMAPVGIYLVRMEALGQVVTRTAIRIR